MSEFGRARLKLTVWYTLIAYLLLGLFTAAALAAEHQAFQTIAELVEGRIHGLFFNVQFVQQLMAFEANFRRELILIDLGLLVVSAIASWFLSGKTLEPIEAMVEQQRLFAADASHELRTPLANISLEIEAFQRTEPDITPATGELLTSVQAEVRRMTNIVDSLLHLVRSEQVDRLVLHPLDVSEVAHEVVAAMQHQFQAKRLAVTVNIAEGVTAMADSGYYRQILYILLDNAVKYTPAEGEVGVQVYQAESQVVTKVRNSGPGISDEDLPHIFERFYRGRHDEAGSGLGLAIANQLLDAQHGQIRASSGDEVTTFSVVLEPVSG